MSVDLVKFQATDGVTLDGYINNCDKKTKKILIQIHGMTSNCFRYRETAIQKSISMLDIDTLCFNNRGSDVAKVVKDSTGKTKIAGTAFEEISECYYDICGALQFAIDKGYKEIYLQGHSLGSTKVVYTYNKLLKENNKYIEYIKALILLSLVDLPMVVRHYGKDYISLAEQKVSNGEENYMMQEDAFPYPLSARTFLRYVKNNDDINFAKFGNEEDNFEILNSFKIPLFFRWGNVNEILLLDIDKQVDFVKRKIKNPHIDVGYIEGANHSYYGKEKQLAEEITAFISNT